ncbi:Alkaline phosphatase D [Pseudocercospora fuligena]|uniref:Alkaline phosphatase D n=1 Tax=Pseudocercospora fuligena TaxID=685502 RepID=A0A8H6R5B0_9PEZI|nr:Alkaline phosphatase D [Pseudocercospora fuligena]
MRSFQSFLAFAAVAAADWSGNINYGSPSNNHNLGISLPKVRKRQESASYMKASDIKFTHGVASGDPYANSVILWTRASPVVENDDSNVTVSGTAALYNHDTQQYVKASSNPICVQWVVSANKDLNAVSAQGKAYTSSDIDYTVKVEAKGLEPFTWYYYQFSVCDSQNKSPLGRTKTAPAPGQDVENVGVAVFSCSNFPVGFFNAYGNSARKDNVDYVIHLGDYIYEYGTTTPERTVHPSREIFTLYDYRTRIATYRTDKDLLLSHSQFPWIPTWDDHEVSNNGYRDGSSGLNNTEESFEEFGGVSVDQRKMNAVRAYFEWMPIRQVDMDNNLRIWRNFSIGSLFDLIVLDTRNYDRSITDLTWNEDYIPKIMNDAGRTMMGSIQENWFYNNLKRSTATWRLIGSQVVFSTINATSWLDGAAYNTDAWDGYMANKNRTLKTLYDNNIGNNIVMAGDTHANWVADLVWLEEKQYNSETGSGALGVEFAGTAVSSTSSFGANTTLWECNNQSRALIADNPELQWQEGYYRGYYEMQISKDRILAQYFGTPYLQTRNGYEVPLGNFTIENGANHLTRPVGGGKVENGALQNGGNVAVSNVTLDTNTGVWFEHNYTKINLTPAPSGGH